MQTQTVETWQSTAVLLAVLVERVVRAGKLGPLPLLRILPVSTMADSSERPVPIKRCA